MAAPAITARSDPSGIKLDDGYRCLYAFAANPTLSLWEKTVQPPGIDTGDSIDTTTMHNDRWRTAQSRALLTLTPMQSVCAYDPAIYTQLEALAGVEGAITIHYPDGSTVSFFGYFQKADFAPLEEGKQAEATVTIVPTNFDPVAKVEAGPLVVSAVGT